MKNLIYKLLFCFTLLVIIMVNNINTIYAANNTHILGDVNQDTEINMSDILLVLRHIYANITNKEQDWILKSEKFELADTNKNGRIDIGDVLILNRYIATCKSETIKQKYPEWYYFNQEEEYTNTETNTDSNTNANSETNTENNTNVNTNTNTDNNTSTDTNTYIDSYIDNYINSEPKKKGFKYIDNKLYYFGKNGNMLTGWQTINGKKYYFYRSDKEDIKNHSKGSAATYLNNIDGSWYYMDPATGACQSGWRDFEGLKYYFDTETYRAAIGQATINGKVYNFNSKGILQDNDYFKITLIDIGGGTDIFGDMTLLESNGKYLLVDTGIAAATRVVGYLKEHQIRNLDIMISHFHRDHVGNLNKILYDSYFNVGTVYLPGTYGGYYDTAKKYAHRSIIISEGSNINFGCVNGKVIYKNGNPSTNDGSAAVMFEGAGIRYFTAGDIEKPAENAILNRNLNIKADVFKFNHHGVPETSNQQSFLNKVSAAIYVSNCCGDDTTTMNTWGAPSYTRAKKTGGMVLSSRYNGSFSLNAIGGHITLTLPRHSGTKTIRAFNVRTGIYENIQIKVNTENNNIKSNVVLPCGYRFSE